MYLSIFGDITTFDFKRLKFAMYNNYVTILNKTVKSEPKQNFK